MEQMNHNPQKNEIIYTNNIEFMVYSLLMTKKHIVARYGGKEFAILFSEKHLDDVYLILDRIRLQIAEIHHPELGRKEVTISIRLTEYNRGTNKEVVFKLADEALYIAKKSGKNRILMKTAADHRSI
jgi:diguanylate cyclase (GGDEF)-like protein